jgi:hypothetical protein
MGELLIKTRKPFLKTMYTMEAESQPILMPTISTTGCLPAKNSDQLNARRKKSFNKSQHGQKD